MLENLFGLWALQQLDSDLDTLRAKAEDIPRKIEGLNLTVSSEKKELEALRTRIIELKRQNKLVEIDLKETEDRINAKSAQLYTAKTNEQYKAFLKEIENLRHVKSEAEDKMIGLMENLEQAEQRVKTLEKEVKTVEDETVGRVHSLKQELEQLQAAIVQRETERKRVVEGIAKDIVNVYERIRRSKRGIAVVSVNGDRCNGCLNPLPPQLLLEIGKKDRLHFCEHCGRILVPSDIT